MSTKEDGHVVTFASDEASSDGNKDVHLHEYPKSTEYQQNGSSDGSSDSVKEVFPVESIDPVLAKKMALVNEAIDNIGMTNFQWKMFILNGFGYSVDSVHDRALSLSLSLFTWY